MTLQLNYFSINYLESYNEKKISNMDSVGLFVCLLTTIRFCSKDHIHLKTFDYLPVFEAQKEIAKTLSRRIISLLNINMSPRGVEYNKCFVFCIFLSVFHIM